MVNNDRSVRIIEVGPRDGLQNESQVIPTQDKFNYIQKLVKAGLKTIEVTSFVRVDRVPQMKDSKQLYRLVKDAKFKGVNFPCLVPNLKGLEIAQEVKVDEIAIFSATSETFNKKNINASIDESIINISKIIKAKSESTKVRAYVSTVWGCPYEGQTSFENLKKVIDYFLSIGVYEISLGDTIGVGTPESSLKVCELIKKHYDLNMFSFHFHDTYARALSNIYACLKEGARNFDASSGGLGGCPYAKGASGNVATEDLVSFLHAMNYQTGVDLDLLVEASDFILDKLGRPSASKVYNAIKATT